MLQTEAYILWQEPIGEADRRYILLTKEAGKIEAWARGVRRIQAKLAGHLEPPNLSWVSIIESNRGWQIAQALERTSFPNIRNDAGSLKAVFKAAQFVRDFMPESSRDSDIVFFWEDFLRKLETEKPNPAWFLAQFILKGLVAFGFFPSLDSCSECGRKFGREKIYLKDLQFVCENCAGEGKRDFEIHPKTRDVIRVILGDVSLPTSDQQESIKHLSNTFVEKARRFML